MAVHKLKLKELSALFFQQLKEQYLDGDMEVEIRVKSKKSITKEEKERKEAHFWKIIHLLDWESKGDDIAILQPAIDYLSNCVIEDIYLFQDMLSEKLFSLDGKKYAQEIGENAYGLSDYFSADIFLYARCCAVANGRKRYQTILKNPKKMVKNLTFEPLLSLANEAHLKKTGKPTEHIPAFNYETFFNSEGWGRKHPLF